MLLLFPNGVSTCLCLHQLFWKMCHFSTPPQALENKTQAKTTTRYLFVLSQGVIHPPVMIYNMSLSSVDVLWCFVVSEIHSGLIYLWNSSVSVDKTDCILIARFSSRIPSLLKGGGGEGGSHNLHANINILMFKYDFYHVQHQITWLWVKNTTTFPIIQLDSVFCLFVFAW